MKDRRSFTIGRPRIWLALTGAFTASSPVRPNYSPRCQTARRVAAASASSLEENLGAALLLTAVCRAAARCRVPRHASPLNARLGLLRMPAKLASSRPWAHGK